MFFAHPGTKPPHLCFNLRTLKALLAAELADGEDDDEVSSVTVGTSSAPADGFVDLWPFAYPTHYWESVLTNLGEGDKAQALAILSPSAHPAPWVVGRRKSADVFVFTRRQSGHSHKHAVALGKGMRQADLGPAVEAGVPATSRATRRGLQTRSTSTC